MPTRSQTIRMTLEQARAAAAGIPSPATSSDEEIERRAKSDPDAPLATDEQLAGAEREYRAGATRLRPKQLLSLRIDADVVEAYRATGPGWQGRMHAAIVAGAPRVAVANSQYPRVAERTPAPTSARAPERVIAALNTLADYVTAPIVYKDALVHSTPSVGEMKKEKNSAAKSEQPKPGARKAKAAPNKRRNRQ